mmetsp:Transcript_19428/g.42443  ORF Transcript_19428/g.42443 Transcript_19428/m.42443 type:complete len:303 (-) Transcript_19428:140-1048(-)
MAELARRQRRRAALVAVVAFAALVACQSVQWSLASEGPGAFVVPGGRRGALLGAVAATFAGNREALGYAEESNRIAAYNAKAKQLNDAADWYLFELQPLIFPTGRIMEGITEDDCDAMGASCPAIANMAQVSEMFQPVGASRSGQITLSKPERDLFSPLKILAMDSVFDPDVADDLREDSEAFERTALRIGQSARKNEVQNTRNNYKDAQKKLNQIFVKINSATGLPENSPEYLTPMPTGPLDDTLENNYYWKRRHDKWLVKKKVDAISKGNKSARFYAKSIFGDDAVSWDYRGDRATEFQQ